MDQALVPRLLGPHAHLLDPSVKYSLTNLQGLAAGVKPADATALLPKILSVLHFYEVHISSCVPCTSARYAERAG